MISIGFIDDIQPVSAIVALPNVTVIKDSEAKHNPHKPDHSHYFWHARTKIMYASTMKTISYGSPGFIAPSFLCIPL